MIALVFALKVRFAEVLDPDHRVARVDEELLTRREHLLGRTGRAVLVDDDRKWPGRVVRDPHHEGHRVAAGRSQRAGARVVVHRDQVPVEVVGQLDRAAQHAIGGPLELLA